MTTVAAFALMTVAWLVGAAGAVALPRGGVRLMSGVMGAFGSAMACVLAALVLLGQAPLDLAVPGMLAPAGGILIHLDPLGAWFVGLAGLVGLPASIYGIAYTADARYSLRLLGAMFNLFLIGMTVVPCAGNVLTFVLAWELMAVTSYFLVMTEAADPTSRRAGLWYIGMTHFGLVLLLPMFFLLAPSDGGSLSFPSLKATAALLPAGTRNVVFLLALLAFGSKAGVVPLHVWLPRAHPAAPSHVSALMSGAMIKLGIYGLLRVSIDLLGGGPAWWGGLVLALGSVSALLGVLYALMEHDLKRLLAYHSVENIGIIVIGVGAGLLLHSYHLDALASISFAGALFHCLNHATFKGLLFLGAGSVLHATGTRDMEHFGGLMKRMPQTALLFLIGSAAISALPPLNGFASEWMLFQGLLAGAYVPKPEVAVAIPVAVGMLALTSGLAAACFVKAFGVSFLAMPRSPEAAEAHEAPASMRVAMWILAVSCIVLGVGASAFVPVIYRLLDTVDGLSAAGSMQVSAGLWIAAPRQLGQISPALIAAMLGLLVAAGLLLVTGARRRLRVAPTWGCGRIVQTARMEYTATAFAEPLRRVFAELYRPTEDLAISSHPDSRYFIKAIAYRSEVRPWIENAIYTPVIQLARRWSTHVRRLQGGSAHLYLLYLIAALIAALASAWWW
jgi:hydrogenase-4 component B